MNPLARLLGLLGRPLKVGPAWGARCAVCGKVKRQGDPGAPMTLTDCGDHTEKELVQLYA